MSMVKRDAMNRVPTLDDKSVMEIDTSVDPWLVVDVTG